MVDRIYDEALIIEYAAGTLCLTRYDTVIHAIKTIPHARDTWLEIEKLAGALFDHHCDPVPMCENALNSVLKRLEEIITP